MRVGDPCFLVLIHRSTTPTLVAQKLAVPGAFWLVLGLVEHDRGLTIQFGRVVHQHELKILVDTIMEATQFIESFAPSLHPEISPNRLPPCMR